LSAIGMAVCVTRATSLPAIVGEEEGAREKFANIDEASNHIPIVVKLDSGSCLRESRLFVGAE